VFYLIADEETNKKLQINQAQYDHMLNNARKIEERMGNGIKVMPTAAGSGPISRCRTEPAASGQAGLTV
jgi:hypothetical protein